MDMDYQDNWQGTNMMNPDTLLETEEQIERDMAYMRRLYPDIGREVSSLIGDECDKLEYEGSCMFDQYPDKVTLQQMTEGIYGKMRHYESKQPEILPLLKDMIQIMLCQEFLTRRQRYNRRCKLFHA